MPALVRKENLEDLTHAEAHHGNRRMPHLGSVELDAPGTMDAGG